MRGRYLLSTLTEFPLLKDPQGKPLPEVALAGRSNVGKSSLINHLLAQKKLAKTSATPGKTQLLNFFAIDEKWLLVDLPGYGFAKAPREAIEKWSAAIDSYLNNRPHLKLILLLIDSRREVSGEETSFMSWAKQKQIPLLMVFTKSDKLSPFEVQTLLNKYPEAILSSIVNPATRHLVEKRIASILWD